MKQIVAMLGDYYHREADSRASLLAALQSQLGEGSINVRFIGKDQLVGVLSEQPDAVVLFAEDRLTPQEDEDAKWMTDEIAASIVRYVEAGGGWLAWHSGLASYDPQGDYVSMLKGYFLSHPSEHQPVKYSGDNIAFEIMDEHYFVECRTEETEVFLRSSSIDGASIAGWRHAHGAGRVLCLTPAHRPEGLLHADVLKLLERSVVWCAGE
ncbi:ThuA domain-containing protein [Cohnella yongneupensis]|uniref:ThuA domain-containing protein n=1 Tax=Cohnella yongneupensis TaxID=425006 RepID=A0ABW0QXC4_9BACL